MGINVLSLFDGISCGMVALERAGIEVNNYYASEIDKYAVQVSEKNYPDIIRLGDVTKWGEWDIDFKKIGLLLAGFPCQAWSVAGHQQGDLDPRGMLLWDMLNIYNHIKNINPNLLFLFENVQMKKDFQDYVNTAIGVTPICINSSLLSAQNRKRNYWTNIPNVTQPEDKGIMLKDIIEGGDVDRNKSYCIDANYWKGGNLRQYLEKARRQLVFKDKSQVMLATKYKENVKSMINRRKFGLCVPTVGRIVGRRLDENGVRQDYSNIKAIQQLEPRADQKSGTLTTVQKDNVLIKPIGAEDIIVRKLTPLECERLQTLPDGYTSRVSNSQRYKCIGNGWTVDVISHILKNIKGVI